MPTDKEQLIELRKAVILQRLEGKPEYEKEAATHGLKYMNFDDHNHFMKWVDENHPTGEKSSEAPKKATEAELDAVLKNIGIKQLSGSSKEPDTSESEVLDQVMKHFRL